MAVSNGPLPPVPYTKEIATIVADFAAAAQANSKTPLNFNVGSVLLALAQATAGTADWLQKLFLFALLISRLTTSQGQWVDTWTADFMPAQPGTNSPRLPAIPATGAVTFSSYYPQAQRIIPVGTIVATAPGASQQTYQVYADTTNSAYSATIVPGGGFIVPANQASININVQALNPGTGGNVAANSILYIQSNLVGIDTVTNAAPLTAGLDQESDAALKARFQLFIASLTAGTVSAIKYAVISLEQGLQVTCHENVDPNGATDYGAVAVYVGLAGGDAPSSTLVSSASTAVNGIRAAGVRPSVLAATPLTANISMSVNINAGYTPSLVVAAVSNAIGAYVNNIGLENPLYYTQLANVAYQASPGVANVTELLLNNGTADLVPAMGQTIQIGTLAVDQGIVL